jgi:hypothetical protein
MKTEAGNEGKVATPIKFYPNQQQAMPSDILVHIRNAILKFTLRRNGSPAQLRVMNLSVV